MAKPSGKKQQPPSSTKQSAPKKQKQPTQRPEMQRVMVVGSNGKRRFEWRPW
jgi:hypothetical protein